jgi:hypothetical protein
METLSLFSDQWEYCILRLVFLHALKCKQIKINTKDQPFISSYTKFIGNGYSIITLTTQHLTLFKSPRLSNRTQHVR